MIQASATVQMLPFHVSQKELLFWKEKFRIDGRLNGQYPVYQRIAEQFSERFMHKQAAATYLRAASIAKSPDEKSELLKCAGQELYYHAFDWAALLGEKHKRFSWLHKNAYDGYADARRLRAKSFLHSGVLFFKAGYLDKAQESFEKAIGAFEDAAEDYAIGLGDRKTAGTLGSFALHAQGLLEKTKAEKIMQSARESGRTFEEECGRRISELGGKRDELAQRARDMIGKDDMSEMAVRMALQHAIEEIKTIRKIANMEPMAEEKSNVIHLGKTGT